MERSVLSERVILFSSDLIIYAIVRDNLIESHRLIDDPETD